MIEAVDGSRAGDRPAAPPGRLARWEAALPGLLVVVVALAVAVDQGGYAPTTWYTAGLFVAALLVVVAVLSPVPADERSPVVTAGVVALGALAVFSLLSVTWAEDEGAAVEGGNRALVYALAVAVVARRRWERPAAAVAVGTVTVGLSLTALTVVAITALGDQPSDLFLEGRLAAPIDYANATANLWLIGFFGALWIATAPRHRWPVRGLGLAMACLLLQSAVLSQSRGAVIAFAVAVIAYVALTPRRPEAVLALGLLLGLTALAFEPLADVRQAATTDALEAALEDAHGAMLRSCLVAALAGAGAGLLAVRAPRRLRTARLRRAGDLAVAGVAIAGAVAALVAIGDPSAWAQDRWEDFKSSGYSQVESGETRFGGSLGSNRYDFYRVALEDFSDRPLVGAGADNFAMSYLQQRRSPEAPRHPHSLGMRLLGQSGLVGTALFAGFAGLLVLAALRARRRAGPATQAVQAAALAGFVAWGVHAMGDWLWAIPGVTLLGLLLLACAARVADERDGPAPPAPAPARARTTAAAAAGLVAALCLAAPGLAARFVSAGYEDFATNPSRTLARLDRAASLNPFSAEPLIARGILARRAGRPELARRSFERAVAREPSGWFGHFELALELGAAGRHEPALRTAARAAALNPGQPAIGELTRKLEEGEDVDPAELEAILTRQLQGRLTPTGGESPNAG